MISLESYTNQEMTPLLQEEELKEEELEDYSHQEYDDVEFSQKELTKPQNLLDLIPKRPPRESSILD